MKKNNPIKNRVVQFGYEHRGIANKLDKVRKSADEVNKMLDNLTKKPEKQGENKNN